MCTIIIPYALGSDKLHVFINQLVPIFPLMLHVSCRKYKYLHYFLVSFAFLIFFLAFCSNSARFLILSDNSVVKQKTCLFLHFKTIYQNLQNAFSILTLKMSCDKSSLSMWIMWIKPCITFFYDKIRFISCG